jgi:phage terminase large subunit-like protein
VIEQALRYPGTKWGVASSTVSELDSVCFGGDSGILAQLQPGELESYNQNKLRARLFNGSLVQGYSADSPDRIRGANLHGLWYDEAASSRYPEFWYAAARPAVRMGRARIVVTTTPRNTKLLRDLTSRGDGSVHITVGRMWENDHLDEGTQEDLRREYFGTRLGRQELEGELLGDFEGALISRDSIEEHRIPPRGPARPDQGRGRRRPGHEKRGRTRRERHRGRRRRARPRRRAARLHHR